MDYVARVVSWAGAAGTIGVRTKEDALGLLRCELPSEGLFTGAALLSVR
jgi:hypothetical protein